MKNVLVTLLSVCLSISALAGTGDTGSAGNPGPLAVSYEANLLAEVLIRQVLAKDLLPKTFQKPHQIKRLKAALEGSNGKMVIEIRNIQCERSLGSDDCSMDIYSRIKGQDAIEQLQVRVYQGTVLSAEMDAM